MFLRQVRELFNTTENSKVISNILFSSNNMFRQKHNLAYLGEALERYEERGFSIDDILQGIVLGYAEKLNFFDASINTNQLSLFKDKFINSCNVNYIPISHIGYIFLMLELEPENYEEEVLRFIRRNKLDENFLILIEAFSRGFFEITTNIKQEIALKLQEEKFFVDFIKLIRLTISDNCSSHSIYSNIRDIIKIFEFKSKDFKDKEVFKVLTSYKKIGSNRLELFDSDSMLKCFGESEDVFWLLNLKIARETLAVGGSALQLANNYFAYAISKTLNLSRKNFDLFADIPNVSLLSVDFSSLDENRYDSLLLLLKRNKIKIKTLGKSIYTKSAFIELLKNSVDNSSLNKITFLHLCLDIITDVDDIYWKEFFFNLIKETNCSLDYLEYAILIEEGLLEFKDCLDSNINNLIQCLYGSSTYSNEELAKTIVSSFYDGLITSESIHNRNLSRRTLTSYYRSSTDIFSFVYKTISSYINAIYTEDKRLAIEMIKKLEYFLFNLVTANTDFNVNCYVRFIINALDNEIYLEALELSKDDVKEIAKTLLDFNNITDASTLHLLNTYAYSQREADLLKLEIQYGKIKTHIFERYTNISILDIEKFIKQAVDLDMLEYYSNLICEALSIDKELSIEKYINIICCLYSLDAISREKRDELITQKVETICAEMTEQITN